jgi:hypothetical protein
MQLILYFNSATYVLFAISEHLSPRAFQVHIFDAILSLAQPGLLSQPCKVLIWAVSFTEKAPGQITQDWHYFRSYETDRPSSFTKLKHHGQGCIPCEKSESTRNIKTNYVVPQRLSKHMLFDLNSQSIRPLRIRPAEAPDDIIACHVHLATIGEEYTCLSYVWGAPHPGQYISMNGQQFWVRQNLWEFLYTSRSMLDLQSQLLWIDALCIDQESIVERQHQVRQMGLIFSAAKAVASWLGMDEAI